MDAARRSLTSAVGRPMVVDPAAVMETSLPSRSREVETERSVRFQRTVSGYAADAEMEIETSFTDLASANAANCPVENLISKPSSGGSGGRANSVPAELIPC